MPNENILALSVDYDDCYCYINYGYKVTHHFFHTFVLDLIKKENYDEVVLLVGSARQSRYNDTYAHIVRNGNGSITQTLPQLSEFLEKNLPIPVSLCKWLLEDVFMGHNQARQFDIQREFVISNIPKNSFIPNIHRNLDRKLIENKEISKIFFPDENKVSIVLFQTHLLNILYPSKNIHYVFIDDCASKYLAYISSIEDFHSLLPSNINLQYVDYQTSGRPRFLDSNPIKGSRHNFLNTIKQELMDQLAQHESDETYDIDEKKLMAILRKEMSRHSKPLINLGLFRHLSDEVKEELKLSVSFVDATSVELKVKIHFD